MHACNVANPFFVVKWSTTPPLMRQGRAECEPATASNLGAASTLVLSQGRRVEFCGAGGRCDNTVKTGGNWHRKIPKETIVSVGLKTRIASHDTGIAQVTNDASNPI